MLYDKGVKSIQINFIVDDFYPRSQFSEHVYKEKNGNPSRSTTNKLQPRINITKLLIASAYSVY
jgi:hypothetical protein